MRLHNVLAGDETWARTVPRRIGVDAPAKEQDGRAAKVVELQTLSESTPSGVDDRLFGIF